MLGNSLFHTSSGPVLPAAPSSCWTGLRGAKPGVRFGAPSWHLFSVENSSMRLPSRLAECELRDADVSMARAVGLKMERAPLQKGRNYNPRRSSRLYANGVDPISIGYSLPTSLRQTCLLGAPIIPPLFSLAPTETTHPNNHRSRPTPHPKIHTYKALKPHPPSAPTAPQTQPLLTQPLLIRPPPF
ncbi:hypothetical protein BDY21DRAFT_351869 [Lineolata rhizophorae]|uniref:Uncharacterized protein n=1 Tax=Lineolata rhizophorae TaxID=578093 RepID=A0A6A6NTR2_9PEZI|nr:hypothetical protein BDY21DRAFT_351869 [Lineolata rhizophorae]